MANFEEFKKKATETANVVVDKSAVYAKAAVEKAKIIGRIAKLRAEIAQERDKARKDYIKIGKLYYEANAKQPEPQYAEVFDDVSIAIAALEAKNAELASLKAELSTPFDNDDKAEAPYADIIADVVQTEVAPEKDDEAETETGVEAEPVVDDDAQL